MTELRIERSHGHPVLAGGIIYRPGGGYSGLTQALDDAVQGAAEWLATAFPHHGVVIRFNSDRRSGGAWLKSGGRSFRSDTQVGLCAGLVPPPAHRIAIEAWAASGFQGEPPVPPAERVLAHYAHAVRNVLRDPSLATDRADAKYAHIMFATADEARAWITQHVDPSKPRGGKTRHT